MNQERYSLTQIPFAWKTLTLSTCQCNETHNFPNVINLKEVMDRMMKYCRKFGKWDELYNNSRSFAEITYHSLTGVEPFRKSFI